MTDKRQKATKVKCKREESLTKPSIFVEYSLLQKNNLSFAEAPGQINTALYQNRPEDTQNQTNLYLEPHDYRIYYVNTDLRHQYGISVAESQTFLFAKRPQRRRARRNGCFRRLLTHHFKTKAQFPLQPNVQSFTNEFRTDSSIIGAVKRLNDAPASGTKVHLPVRGPLLDLSLAQQICWQ